MKISYYIPEGKKNYENFIGKELSFAPHIKNKSNRLSIMRGLTKIKNNLSDGKAFFWDGKELNVIDYYGKSGRYYCGRDFDLSLLKIGRKSQYLLVVMDANECIIGELRGKKIVRLWKETSHVPRKHNQGGQSQARFQRARQESLKNWLKKIGSKIQFYWTTHPANKKGTYNTMMLGFTILFAIICYILALPPEVRDALLN